MTEPLVLEAGFNYLSLVDPKVLIDYFSSLLFAPLGTPNLIEPERGWVVELVVALRFMQQWWLDKDAQQLLPKWVCNSCISTPSRVVDLRRYNNFSSEQSIKQIVDQDYTKIMLPSSFAGPDLRYSVFAACIKTTWTK